MAFWFGRKSAPEVRPFVPVWLAGETDSGEFVRGYRARLEEVYRRNPVGLRAVRLVAGLTGSLPLFAEEGDAKAVELVRAGGLLEQLAAALLLHGNAYVRLVADGHDKPAELFAMRPDRTSISCGPDGWPAAYVYRGGGQAARIARTDALGRRQVAHLKALNPGDDHYGLGCLKAACPAASIHGSAVPRIYGRMRVAGTVVWATDLKEEEAIEGGGKGSPERLGYSYSVSLAVALSSRPIRSVRRIWADGKLIRGSGGQFTVPAKFRVATGSEDQPVDPLIASIETIARTPAYRGLALAIFEDLQLAEFGNRIPVLTFEVEAEDAPVAIADLVADASGGLIELTESRIVTGYAAHGSSIGESVRPLVEHLGLPLAERDGKLRGPAPSNPVQLNADELGCDADGKPRPPSERLRVADASLPASQSLIYYDVERDFQAGQMRASSGGGGTIDERTELPAVLTANEAKLWVEEGLARRWQAAGSVRLRLPPPRMGLAPGDHIQLPGSARVLTVRNVEIDGMAVVVEAEAAASGTTALPADPGRAVPDPDEPIGRTELALFELPALGDAPESAPQLVAAGSNQGKWKPVPIEVRLGSVAMAGQALGRRAVLGTATTSLDPRAPMILDELSSVTIQLVNEGHVLLNADTDAMASGANLAVIGEELIQFGRAAQLEPGLFRLSHLLRGRRGTEWAASTHEIGERFCLLNSAALAPIDLPASATGAALRVISHGIADSAPLPEAQREVCGEAMRPQPVCHLRTWRVGASVHLSWIRRSHRGWAWNDGVGVPADSFPERYRLTVTGPEGQLELEYDEPGAIFDSASLPAMAGQMVEFEVRTIGPMALSRPRVTSLTL